MLLTLSKSNVHRWGRTAQKCSAGGDFQILALWNHYEM